jgi:hypothetical protein
MNLMPILYTPKSRYTSDTNVWVPFLVTFLRAGAIAMLEWLSLRFVENAPLAVCIATGVFAVAVLAILQTKDWLDFKGKWYFRGSLLFAVITWIAVVAYGYWAYPPQDKIIPTFPTADEIAGAVARKLPTPQSGMFSEAAPKPSPAPRSKQTINELLDEIGKLLDLVQKTGIPLRDEWQILSSKNPERICLDLDTHTLQDQISKLTDRFHAAQAAIAAILEENRIDQPELSPLIGGLHGAQPPGFIDAITSLTYYRNNIARFGDHPSCEMLVGSNSVPNIFLVMDRGLQQFSVWLGESQNRLVNYRDALRKELRNAP